MEKQIYIYLNMWEFDHWKYGYYFICGHFIFNKMSVDILTHFSIFNFLNFRVLTLFHMHTNTFLILLHT